MEKLIIRDAAINDYQSIFELNKNCLGYDFDINKTKQRLNIILNNKQNKIFVATINNKVVGYVHGCNYECSYFDSLKNILALAVDSNYQKLGIGKQLLLEIESWAKNDGAIGIRLVSGIDRVEAHKFYERCGFTNRKKQMNFIKVFELEK